MSKAGLSGGCLGREGRGQSAPSDSPAEGSRTLDLGRLSESERIEWDALNAKVRGRDPVTGRYLRWTDQERDRVRELLRKRDPSIRFAPSTEEMGRRFGHLSRRAS